MSHTKSQSAEVSRRRLSRRLHSDDVNLARQAGGGAVHRYIAVKDDDEFKDLD